MPAEGFRMERENLIDVAFHKKFVKETGIDIDYHTFKKIIVESNKEIVDIVLAGNDGFKLPRHLGILAITAFKSKKKPIDWINSNKFKKRIYHLNLNTFSKVIAINWYRVDITQLALAKVFKFKASRNFARAAAKLAKSGKQYNTWQRSDFYDATRMERILIKRSKRKNNGTNISSQ